MLLSSSLSPDVSIVQYNVSVIIDGIVPIEVSILHYLASYLVEYVRSPHMTGTGFECCLTGCAPVPIFRYSCHLFFKAINMLGNCFCRGLIWLWVPASASPFADGRHCMQRAALYRNLIESLILHQNPTPLELGEHLAGARQLRQRRDQKALFIELPRSTGLYTLILQRM